MRSVLRRLLAGELSEEEAEAELRRVQLTELGERARLDVGREHRRGVPEIKPSQNWSAASTVPGWISVPSASWMAVAPSSHKPPAGASARAASSA